MLFKYENIIGNKLASRLGILLCLPFLFSLFAALTGLQHTLGLITNGHATPVGSAILRLGLAGLSLAFAINFLAMLAFDLKFKNWRAEGKVTLNLNQTNLLITVVSTFLAMLFIGHLIIDGLACHAGNIAACS